ncbi:MAG: bifunctional diguanylate cyclase/phosphodiesterase [Candidatus Dormibacteraeota bacterium]|nr:bifunctional diguanylate cyclase/phosphodiesterase [Candidatus Dormibacteraeota bacterium]
MSNRLWLVAAGTATVCCAALVCVMLLAPVSVTLPTDDLAEVVAPILAAVACVIAGRHQAGRARIGWYLIGASAATWGSGQAAWSWLELIVHQDNPFPSLADVGYMGSVPLLFAGLFTMPVWPSGSVAKLRAVADGLLIAGGLLLISWYTVLSALVASPADTVLGQVISLAYPIGDVIVVTVLAIMWSRTLAVGRGPILLIIGGLGSIAVADSTFAYLQAQASFGSGNVVDIGWVAGYLMVGLAALLSFGRPMSSRRETPPRWPAALLPYMPLPVAIGFAVEERVSLGYINLFTLSMGLGLFLLVLVRQGLAVRENLALMRRLASNESELNHRAEHDPLTDLNNRTSFIRFVDEYLAQRTSDRLCAVMFVDLDDFKHINDSLGHAMGDQAIVAVGQRLKACMRDHDLVARLGGDEFAVFLTRLPDVGHMVNIAERLIETLNEPFQSSDMRASVCGTIGVAIAEEGDDAGELLRRADIAMYAAKARGKGLFGIFEPSMHVAMYAPLERRADLERAADEHEFILHFQPVVDVSTREMVSVEALIRWAHPRLGLLSPAEFIDNLEQAGLMVKVGAWVLEEACRQTVRLRAGAQADISVSVNVSSSQMQDAGFVSVVGDALASTGLPARALVIELTESGSIGESEVVGLRLRQLRALGVRVAIDDFGSGYSSFTYLRRLRVDILKIDKTFVDGLLGGGPGAALVEGMIGLGNSLGLLTVGEGVEVEEQHAALVRLGCSMAQGYLHSRPMPMEQLLLRATDETRQVLATG